MKKFIAILLTLTMVLSLAACASKEAPEAAAPVAPPDMEVETETPDAPTDEPVAPEEAPAETPEEPVAPEAPVEDVPPAEDAPVVEGPAEMPDYFPGDKLYPVLDAILADVDAEFKEYFATAPVEGDAETVGWMLGVNPMPEGYGEILFYGPMHGSTPFLMAIIEMTEGTEGRVFETAMMDNADLVKWVCVEADYAQAATNGSLCLFLMSDETTCSTAIRDQLFANFAAFDAASIG